MNILNWNIRGMNSPRKRLALKDYLQKYQVDIVAIQETKKEEFTNRFLRSLSPRLDLWIHLPSSGASGGILFGGDSNKIEIQSHSIHQFCLDVHFFNKIDRTEWQYTIVYGPTRRHLKKELWKELNTIRQGHTKFWVISGDFNALRTPQDKSGSNFDMPISNMFNQFINQHFLVEHTLNTRKYTWSNGTHFALLDRIFTTVDWDQKYPHSVIQDLCKNGSDHCPLLMQVIGTPFLAEHHFKFDPLWLEQDDFRQFIVKWWHAYPLDRQNIVHSWHQKMGYMRRKIRGWAKNFYGKKKKEKYQLLDRLHILEIIRELREFTLSESS